MIAKTAEVEVMYPDGEVRKFPMGMISPTLYEVRWEKLPVGSIVHWPAFGYDYDVVIRE